MNGGPSAATRRSVWAPLRGIRASFTFLTRIPLGGYPYSGTELGWAVAHFPLVGALVGSLSALVYWAALSASPALAAVLALLASVLLTGAFHEDGLADTADALGGTLSKERVFEILKDSRLGTYGVTALVLSFGLRGVCLAELGERGVVALVLAHCLARAAPVALLFWLPYATPPASSKSHDLTNCTLPHLLVAQGWAALVAVLAVVYGGLTLSQLVLVAAGLVALSLPLARTFMARVGGVTGDFLGASEQVCEALCLVLLLLSDKALP